MPASLYLPYPDRFLQRLNGNAVSLRNAMLLNVTGIDFQYEPGSLPGRDHIFGVRNRKFFDENNAMRIICEYNIQGDMGIFHPEGLMIHGFKNKIHTHGIRQMIPVHKSPGTLIRIISHRGINRRQRIPGIRCQDMHPGFNQKGRFHSGLFGPGICPLVSGL